MTDDKESPAAVNGGADTSMTAWDVTRGLDPAVREALTRAFVTDGWSQARAHREIGKPLGIPKSVIDGVRRDLTDADVMDRPRLGTQAGAKRLAGLGKLGQKLEDAARARRCNRPALTVLSKSNDPYRQDARRADGQWVAAMFNEHVTRPHVHIRGLHYILVSVQAIKPDGDVYRNDDANHSWLSKAVKAARLLELIDPTRITDARNAAGIVCEYSRADPEVLFDYPSIATPQVVAPSIGIQGLEIVELEPEPPEVDVECFYGVQEYRVVMMGEKSSLLDVLHPLAQRYGADLYLFDGCASETRIMEIARTSAEQDRSTIVLYFSDCDPAGWNMPVAVSRSFQAERDLRYPDLRLQVFPVALTPDQVREFALPVTPFSKADPRIPEWKAKMGVEQTEIDALAALRPELLHQIAEDAIAPWYDDTLDKRVAHTRDDWVAEAADTVAQAIDDDPDVQRLLTEAQVRRDRLQPQIDELQAIADDIRRRYEEQARRINADTARRAAVVNTILADGIDELAEAIGTAADEAELPDFDIPEAEPPGCDRTPLFSTDWDYVEATLRLKSHKVYEPEDD